MRIPVGMMAGMIMKQIKCVLSIIIFICLLSCCFPSRQTIKTEFETTYYHFQPLIILEDIANNHNPVFEEVSPEYTPPDNLINSMKWNQNEYWVVIKTFLETKNVKPVENIKINELSSNVSCEDFEHGFQVFYVELFQEIERGNTKEQGSIGNDRNFYRMTIEPQAGILKFTEYSILDGNDNIVGIDLMNLNYSIDTILKLVDEGGGNSIRKRNKNMCTIYLSLDIGQKGNIWNLSYDKTYNVSSLPSYEVEVNDKTRIIKVISH